MEDSLMPNRVDIYSILVKNKYKLPAQWFKFGIKEARKDIYAFLKNQLDMMDNPPLLHKVAIYSDEQWNKLIWRLDENGHKH
jgi:arabinogalactan endo-1,4-beta-galactosidase